MKKDTVLRRRRISNYSSMEKSKIAIGQTASLRHNDELPSPQLNETSEIPSLSTLIEDYKYYASSISKPIEIAVCCALCIGCFVLPDLLVPETFIIPIDTTYQITSNGDVILDPSLNHDYTGEEAVSDVAMIIIAGALPFGIIAVVGFLTGPMFDAHSGLCVLITSMGSTRFMTEYLKRWVGRLRPNFYGMCGFDLELLQCTVENHSLLMDARHSFPSGHSSMAFCGMTVLSFWFLGKVGMQRNFLLPSRGPSRGLPTVQTAAYSKILAFLSYAPFMFIAVYIAASRIRDFYHNADDVIAGAILGIVCSLFSYHIW